MPAETGLLRQAARIAWKDLRVELRSREIIYTMVFFGALLVVVYAFTFPQNEPDAVKAAAPGKLWVSLAFAGTIGLGRAFDRERENDTLRALMLTPVPRLAIFLGKAVAMTLLQLAVAVVCAPLIALFLGAPLFDYPHVLALVILLGTLGFSMVGSVFSATLLKVRSRDVLLPIILYPLLIPMLSVAAKITKALMGSVSASTGKPIPPDFEQVWAWMGFLGIYDLVFLVLSMWIFEALVIE